MNASKTKPGPQVDNQSRTYGKREIARTKAFIKDSLEKQHGGVAEPSDPDIALEVLDIQIQNKQTDRQALFAEHLFRKTIENSIPLGIAGFDALGKQIYVNQMFCDMVGWDAAELMDEPFPQPYWSHEEMDASRKGAASVWNKLLTSDNFETRLKKPDGQSFWVLVSSNILTDDSGLDIGRLISVANIDAQKMVENTLRLLSTRLIGIREQERKMIAQDLHDSIGGKLTGIKYSLEKIVASLEPHSQLQDPMSDSVEAVRSTIEEVQRLTKNLHPSVLDDLGLIAAVRGCCREFEGYYTPITVQTTFDVDEQMVPESQKILIYRVLQEALNNVAKHGNARKVEVVLKGRPSHTELVVEDDGRGFDPQAVSEPLSSDAGMGLASMKERTELFGGSLEIRSQKGKGARIRASWPVSV